MATKMTESRHLYSWWWDSHISPKNSKWLQENLTDTDGKVKAMIKIINEDADSFARRAEMYYRKRPELMKLVEDFYRAYRALAERYDHATGELRLAHRTMIEAFPNQMPFMLSDEPHSPVTPHLDEIFDPDDSNKASSDVGFTKKGLKQLHEMFQSGEATLRELKTAEGRLRGNTQGEEDKDSCFKVVSTLLSERNHGLDLRTMILNESEKAAKVEAEMQRLKQALAKMEAERDAVLAQYHQSLEKLSNLEKELCSAQVDAEELEKCGNEAQSEVKALKESLQKLEVERDSSLQKLEVMIAAAETESRDLKQELSRSESEKQDAVAHYQLSLEKISALEERLWVAEENAKRLSEQNLQAGSEIKALKEEISRLNREKEDAYLRYQQCLEMISKLQNELMEAKEEVRRLKGAEDQCALLEEVNQSLKLEANELVQEIAVKDQRLLEKHAELEKLTSRLQDEQTRFMQVEAALHTLQNMHFQSQEEQRGLADEFRDGIRVLKDVEISKRDMQHEILGLKEIKEKLEAEVTRQAEQNEALQQQFSQLKQELEDLLQQVESAGIDPNCIKSSIKDLEDEKTEKEALLKRLESSLSDVKSELQSSKEKMKALQEFCNTLGGEKSSLMAEKSALLSQLQIITESMQKLLEKNVSLETSLQSANVELEGLRVKSKGLGDFCKFLKDEKSNLQTERSNLVYRLECVEKKLEKLETRFTRLEDKYAGQVEELRVSLVLEKKALKDRDYTLLAECNKHEEAAKYSEKLISELKSENMMQQLETEYLLDRVDTFKRGIFQVLKALEIDHVSETDPEIFLPRIRGSIIEIRRSLSESKDENQELLIQNNVLSAVIKELSSDGVELKARKEAADNEFFNLNQQLQREHSGVLKANRFLHHKLTRLEEEKHMLEEENSAAIVEALSLSNQSVVFKSSWIQTVMELGEKLAMREAENMQLRELTQQLEEKRIKTVQDTNTELYKAVASQENLEQQIFELSACKEHQEKEIVLLQEANGSLENEVSVLTQEIEACKVREVVLNSELHEISSEFELWEAEATSFYFDLQMSSVREALLENKVQELSGFCEDLQNADTRRIIEVERLKNRISFLESDREGLQSKLAAYVPAIASLKDNIASLEQTKACCPATPQKQVAEFMVDESQSKSTNAKEQSSSISDGLSELQDLQSRIKAIERVVVEKKSVQESIQTNIKHEATTTKVLAKQKSRNNSQQPNSMNHDAERKAGSLHNRSRELELRNGIHMKDIPLDHVSASPPTIKRRKSSRLSDQMLELWEASDKTPRPRCSPPRRKCSDSNNSGEIEKELGVDLGFQQGGNKRKIIILERLASDAQKLASLQISVQELRRKMEMNKKSKAAKEIEFKSLKSQIYSVESSVVQLVSMNTELTKTVKGSASSLDPARSRELADVEQALRRKMLEQARRDSERIENLQVEMQKMESLLVKMEDEKSDVMKGGKSGLLRSRTGIILREFVYGRSRSRKQKNPRFCGCFRQSHKEV